MEGSRLTEEIEVLQNEKARLSARKFTVYDDYRNGNSTRERYQHDIEKIQERLIEIGKMIPNLERQIKEADKKIEGVSEKERTLSDIASLETFDREVLSKIIEKV